MIVVTSSEELKGILNGSCVTLGNFDGVHMGHRKLIGRTRDKARKRGLLSIAVTFDPHPSMLFSAGKCPPLLSSLTQKLELIESLGVNIALIMPFTRALAGLEPEDFVRTHLVEGLDMQELVIGYDYAFGKARKGDYDTLLALGRKYGYNLERLDPVIVDGAIVSSTRIRDMLLAGEVWEARPLLGRYHQVRGEVITGHQRGGRLLGFPTANLGPCGELLPKTGVYAVWAGIGGEIIPGVANVGYNPTFGDQTLTVETHLLDFSRNLYGQTIEVHFVQRLRSEKKFSGPEELKLRIAEDANLARRILDTAEAQI